MNVKTNVRAGQGGADNSTVSGQTQTQNQNGKNSSTVVVTYYYPPVSRCVGL